MPGHLDEPRRIIVLENSEQNKYSGMLLRMLMNVIKSICVRLRSKHILLTGNFNARTLLDRKGKISAAPSWAPSLIAAQI